MRRRTFEVLGVRLRWVIGKRNGCARRALFSRRSFLRRQFATVSEWLRTREIQV
jgi:hypothetical protein